MQTIPGFETPDKLKKTYPYFDLNTRQFSPAQGAKFHGGVPIYYDAETRRLYIDAGDTHTLVYG